MKKDHSTSVFTDASDRFCADTVPQTSPPEANKKVEKQQHVLLAFLGGTFMPVQENRIIYEKEAFEIGKVLKKMDYVLWGPDPVKIFTDGRNLLFILRSFRKDRLPQDMY